MTDKSKLLDTKGPDSGDTAYLRSVADELGADGTDEGAAHSHNLQAIADKIDRASLQPSVVEAGTVSDVFIDRTDTALAPTTQGTDSGLAGERAEIWLYPEQGDPGAGEWFWTESLKDHDPDDVRNAVRYVRDDRTDRKAVLEEAAKDFRSRARICRTNDIAFDLTAASVWDAAADELEAKHAH